MEGVRKMQPHPVQVYRILDDFPAKPPTPVCIQQAEIPGLCK